MHLKNGRLLFYFTVTALILQSKENFADPLIGKPYFCNPDEKQVEVASSLLGGNSCLMCYCKNHEVQCHPLNCPTVEGCYRLKPKKKPECCQKCLGCMYEHKKVFDRAQWTNGCQNHECHAGVLTKSDIKCYVPCANPVPPDPGKCCPKCSGCWLEGRQLRENEATTLRTDACVKCVCKKNHITCEKKSCPVLSCPASKTISKPTTCCPRCNGSLEMFMPPGGRCFLGHNLYGNGESKTYDKCTSCLCHSGFLTCSKKSCPPVNCPHQFRIHTSENCCPKCAYPEQIKTCIYRGQLRGHEEKWSLDKCSNCECMNGQVTCRVSRCEYFTKDCPKGYVKELLKTECCPKCVENPGVCFAFNDVHFRTFDEHFFDFHGECRYLLSKDCTGNTFMIRLNNDGRPSNQFPWSRGIAVKFNRDGKKTKVSLGQKLRVKVDKKRVKFPFVTTGLNVTRKNYLISLRSDQGIEINWDGTRYLEIKLDVRWRNKTCGICGNFNLNRTDDRSTKDKKIATSDSAMAASWQASKTSACVKRLKKFRGDEPQKRTQRVTCSNSQSKTHERCAAFMSRSFELCRKTIDVMPYHKSCLSDMCDCEYSRPCECDSISAFVRECQRQQIHVDNWRKLTKCGGFDCPFGSKYMECAPACKASCRKPFPNPECYMKRCRPGCYCPPPTINHRGSCVLPQDCPNKVGTHRGI